MVQQGAHLGGQQQFAERVGHRRIQLLVEVAQHLLHRVSQSGARGHGDPFVGQGVAGQRPTPVNLPHHHLIGNEKIVEEHLVEILVPGDLTQWPDLDTGRAHIDQEVGDALVFRSVGIGPGQAHAPVRLVRCRGPHLLAVEIPTTLSPNGFGAKRGQVRTRARLTEQLAPDQLTAQRRGHEMVDLFGRTVLEDGRHRPPADDQIRARDTDGGEFLIDEQLLGRRGLTAVRLGPMRREQSVAGHGNLTSLDR